MVRPTHHLGSGRSKPIPDDWGTAHAGVIAATLPAMVKVRPAVAGAPAFNPLSGQTEASAGFPVYTGAARITAVTSPPGGPTEMVDEQIQTRVYEVVLAYAVEVAAPGLVVDVTSDPDPMLVGARLLIDDVDRGSNRFSRVLLATLKH